MAAVRPGAGLPAQAVRATCATASRRLLRLRTRPAYILGPLEGFTTRLSVSTYGGIILALPVLLWQIWRFVVPATARQGEEVRDPVRRVVGVVLFLLGAGVAYWTLDKAARVPDRLVRAPTSSRRSRSSKYISLVGLMVAAFGIGFEFPVLLVFLQLVGVLTPQTLMKQWRYAIVIIFVVAAVITPQRRPVLACSPWPSR